MSRDERYRYFEGPIPFGNAEHFDLSEYFFYVGGIWLSFFVFWFLKKPVDRGLSDKKAVMMLFYGIVVFAVLVFICNMETQTDKKWLPIE